MDRFLQHQGDDDDDDDDKFDLSGIGGYRNSELMMSRDIMGSPQSTLVLSQMGSYYQGSSEGSSQDASPPPTPGTCTLLEDERFNHSRQYLQHHHLHHEIIHSLNPPINIGPSSHQSLIQDQIRSIELSRVKQELDANGESEETSVGRRAAGPWRPPPMRAVFLGGSGSRGGTGVFLPRSAPPQSTKKQGKGGCSSVLIPARVVKALQQHFDQMATTSNSAATASAFPPLHDVLVRSNRDDGMYSLQKRQSQAANYEMTLLPQDWTY